jgi:Protein of unknown function (DUF2637)
MDDPSGTQALRQAGYNGRLHSTAVISVITGAALLAVAAFLLSYARIHEIALSARVSPSLAALYPLMFDTTLVIACVAALALRGAPWWMRYSAVLTIMILLAVVAVGEALHAAGISLPVRPTAAILAAVPWVLFLIGFGLVLLVLRYQRRVRAMVRAACSGDAPELAGKPGTRKLSPAQRTAHSARWSIDPDTADSNIVPAEPRRPGPVQQQVTNDAGFTSAHGNGHRHGHGNQHHSEPLG